MRLEWLDEIERRADNAPAQVREDVRRLAQAVRELSGALEEVLEQIEVDEHGLDCYIDDECCAGRVVLKARRKLQRWQHGGAQEWAEPSEGREVDG